MKLLITMAGKGSRFRDAGVTKPKHEILVRGRPMFDWAMESLEGFFEEEFIFVTHEEHSPTKYLKEACDRLGIGEYQEITLSKYTRGQAATAIAADNQIGEREGVAIYNIDTYIEPGVLRPELIQGDGFIPTFTAPGNRWSFVNVGEDNQAQNVSEKEKISEHATAGFYYFDQWCDFTDAFQARANTVENEYGETYVAPLYNHLINNGREVFTHEIARNAIHVLGTPRDLREFDPDFDPVEQ